MRLFIETMDAVLTDFSATGQVRFHGEDWSTPNLQESRAIIHAAQNEIVHLEELVEFFSAVDRASTDERDGG
jgi:hypothetical protein